MKTLKEQFSRELDINKEELIDNLLQVYQNEEYAELAVLLGVLKSMYDIFQSYHWQSTSQSFYGDHLLFQRLYEGMLPQIDSLGERVLGLGQNGDLVCPLKLNKTNAIFARFVEDSQTESFGDNNFDLFMKARHAEETFGFVTEKFLSSMEKKGLLTKGTRNFIEGLLDVHEEFAYLINQRISE